MNHLVEELESRLLLSAAPLVLDGFDDGLYPAGSQLDGSDPDVSGFDGLWSGSGSASIEAGSLIYPGYGQAGDNRVQLNNSITAARRFALTSADPLANFLDANGDVGASLDGSSLYLSVLIQVDGSSPPASTFSLYNNGSGSTDRVFRISYSSSKTYYQAIAGPSGTTVNLDPLNSDTNLFVIRIDFAAGNDVVSIWQNPTVGGLEPTPDAQITNYDIAFDRMAFTRFSGTGSVQFDELRVGQLWSSVTDEAALDLVLQPPISADGFNSVEYGSGQSIDGVWSYIPGYDQAWASLGMTTTESGSLTYTGLGHAGNNRVQLNGTDVVSRLILDGNNTPFANYLDANGDIGDSLNGGSLYLSVLMQVDGASPPASTFSLYNDGVTSADRVFRILYHPSNTNFTAIAGPDGTPVELDPLNTGTNLFVIRIDFAAGNDVVSIWQNPVAGDLEPVPDAQITDYDIAIDRVAFTRYSGTGSTQFDELRFGPNWSSVTDEAALGLLPEPQSIVAMQEAPTSPTGDGMYPAGFFPFIDQFGQYRYMEWDDKTHSVDELIQSATDEAAQLAANPGPADYDQYGGWLAGPQLEATGYFRVEKVDGKWWFVDPDGRLFFSNGITGVSDADREESTDIAVKTGVTGRENYFADLPEPGDPADEFLTTETNIVTSGYYQGTYPTAMNFFAANALTKYGSDWEATSQDIAHDRLRSWGFNTIGAWSDQEVYLQDRTPYTMVIFPPNPSLVNGLGTFPDYFDPQYRVLLENRLLEETGKSLNDPYNIGYFINNELAWTRSTTADTDVGLAALASASTQYAKTAFRDQLIAKYGTIEALNAQWQTSYTSWTDFLNQRNVTPNMAGANDDLVAFDQLYANQYHSETLQALRNAAPNHLYLGTRFTGGVRYAAAVAAMTYADVVSINRYGPDVSVLPAGLEGDKPLISGEYHFSANDTGLLSDGLKTADDQADRADMFATYLTSALNDDRYVGVHWLQYWDYPSAGKLNSGNNNSNLGFVSITDTPYTEMVDAARTVGASLYETRTGDFGLVYGRTLYITGTESADTISLQTIGVNLDATRNGVTHHYALTDFDAVVFSGGYGADMLNVTNLIGQSLTVQGAEAQDSINILSGDFSIRVDADGDGPGMTVAEVANVDLLTGSRIGSLDNLGRIEIVASGSTPGTVTIGALSMGAAAILDLADNGLVLDYTGASPINTLRMSIISAYNIGTWSGNGITTRYGDATQSAIGYAESGDVLGPSGGTFMDETVDASAVLIRHTLYADANLSTGVDGSDFNRWNVNRDGAGNWSDGDFNYDGLVNQADLDLWSLNRFTTTGGITLTTNAVTSTVMSSQEAVVSANKNETVAVDSTAADVSEPAAVERTKQRIKHKTRTIHPKHVKTDDRHPSMAGAAALLDRFARSDREEPAWFGLPALDIKLPATHLDKARWIGRYRRLTASEDTQENI